MFFPVMDSWLALEILYSKFICLDLMPALVLVLVLVVSTSLTSVTRGSGSNPSHHITDSWPFFHTSLKGQIHCLLLSPILFNCKEIKVFIVAHA